MTHTPADPVIRTQILTRDFPSTRAVDGLSIEVPRGIVFGFLGPNGSGKTTTIRMLLGLLEPTSGKAEVLGFDTLRHGNDIRLRCGALLEHPGLYEPLSAEDNLQLYARIWNMPAGERNARIKELLESFGLWDRRKDPAGKWSHGMKKKLAVARAMLHRPALLFLDEPSAGLDPVAAVGLREELASVVRREGVTVFLTTHNLSEAEKLCSRVAVIRQGRLLAEGPPDELRSSKGGQRIEVCGNGFSSEILDKLRAQSAVRSVTLRDDRLLVELHNGSKAAPLVRLLVEAGAEIEEVRKGSVSLEDVFLALVEEDRGRE
jgi:ABC-2 type transport system ATP-binding protein